MYIVVVGLNHKTAPVEVREKLAFKQHELPRALNILKDKNCIAGCVILSTCNRTEVYVAATEVEAGLGGIYDFLSKSCGLPLSEIRDYLYRYTLYDAVRHLFRVASGLDSMILGETQILGQVRQAYQWACEHGATNNILNTLFQQAISVGKKVRTATKIDQNAVSVSYAAVELAKKYFGKINGRSVLIMGAGKMSELTVRYLVANGVSTVFVTNRSYERACTLASEFGGKAVRLDELKKYLPTADILISCTAASHYVLKKEDVEPLLSGRKETMLFIDIAVPRDIDPEVGKIPGVILHDIDDLHNVVDQNLEERKNAAAMAEDIIEEEIDTFFKWLSSLFVVPTIISLKEKATQIKEMELAQALRRLSGLSEKEKNIVASMANSIVNQLIHDPIVNLKKYASTHQGHLYTEILQNLFNLEVKEESSRLNDVTCCQKVK
ncbi:glutamyl-tRNA reductase [Zhaonella formicivorans]|jgi:glutamyl-tRNA reductase|uniref:glutamyl-tRNA reductase n=1 Tax=Zhaonella formicivorans TaxID=2528593 RepID=UPI0010E19A66|nr:glutamyl-tRNA reductase [Zhaonella formicivorans]